MAVDDYSTTPASNTAISGIDIDEGCSPGGINNAIRQLMADIKTYVNTTATTISGLMPKSGGTFTGAVNGTEVTLSGDLNANRVEAETTDAEMNIIDSDGTFAGALNSRLNFRAQSTIQGRVGFVTSSGLMQVRNNRGDVNIDASFDGTAGSTLRLRTADTTRLTVDDDGTTVAGDLDVTGDSTFAGATASTLDVTATTDLGGHVDIAANSVTTLRGARGFFYYTGSTTLSFGDTTSGANIAPVSIDVAGSGGGSGGSGSTGLTTANINLGTSPSGTWTCNGYAVQNSITEFVRTG